MLHCYGRTADTQCQRALGKCSASCFRVKSARCTCVICEEPCAPDELCRDTTNAWRVCSSIIAQLQVPGCMTQCRNCGKQLRWRESFQGTFHSWNCLAWSQTIIPNGNLISETPDVTHGSPRMIGCLMLFAW